MTVPNLRPYSTNGSQLLKNGNIFLVCGGYDRAEAEASQRNDEHEAGFLEGVRFALLAARKGDLLLLASLGQMEVRRTLELSLEQAKSVLLAKVTTEGLLFGTSSYLRRRLNCSEVEGVTLIQALENEGWLSKPNEYGGRRITTAAKAQPLSAEDAKQLMEARNMLNILLAEDT